MARKAKLFRAAVLICLALVAAAMVGAQTPANPTATPDYLELLKQARSKSAAREPAAVAWWEKVLALNPHDGRNWREYGLLLLELKDYRKAIAAYEKAYELGAGYPWEQFYSIARCYALMGDKQQTLQYLERAANAGHRNLNLMRANKELDLVRDEPKFKELFAIADVSRMSRDEGWRFDLQWLAREIKRLHYNPYRRVSCDAFDAYVKKLHDEIPKLSEPQIVVRLMRLASMAGDGHTALRHPAYGQDAKKLLPVQFYLFSEGLFILAATPCTSRTDGRASPQPWRPHD